MDHVDQEGIELQIGGAGGEASDAAELLQEIQHPNEHIQRALA